MASDNDRVVAIGNMNEVQAKNVLFLICDHTRNVTEANLV